MSDNRRHILHAATKEQAERWRDNLTAQGYAGVFLSSRQGRWHPEVTFWNVNVPTQAMTLEGPPKILRGQSTKEQVA